MATPWREFWEWRFQQRHGYPSQSARADLERQAAFLDDVFAHGRPDCDMNMLPVLVDDFNEALRQQLLSDIQTEQIRREAAQSHFFKFVLRMSRLQRMAIEVGVDLDEALLQQFHQYGVEQDFETNYGHARGSVPTVQGLQNSIGRTTEIVINRYIEQRAGTEPCFPSNPLPGSSRPSSMNQTTRDDLEISQSLQYDPNSCPGRVGRDSLPSYNAVHDIHFGRQIPSLFSIDLPYRLRGQGTSPRIDICPRLEPPPYTTDPPPDYWTSQPEGILRHHRQRQGFSNGSDNSRSSLYGAKECPDLLNNIRRLSTQFITDPRSRHTSHGAQKLGILCQISNSASLRRHQRGSAQDFSHRRVEANRPYTLGKKRSLQLHCLHDDDFDRYVTNPAKCRRVSMSGRKIRTDSELEDIGHNIKVNGKANCYPQRSVETSSAVLSKDSDQSDSAQTCSKLSSLSRHSVASDDEDNIDGIQTFSWAESLSLDFESDVNESKSPISLYSLPFSFPDLNDLATLPTTEVGYAAALKSNLYSVTHNAEGRRKIFTKDNLQGGSCAQCPVDEIFNGNARPTDFVCRTPETSRKILYAYDHGSFNAWSSPLHSNRLNKSKATTSSEFQSPQILWLQDSPVNSGHELGHGTTNGETCEQTGFSEDRSVHLGSLTESSFLRNVRFAYKFKHPFDSVEHLAQAHSYKQKADTANMSYYWTMQKHEQEMHQRASECWLPGDIHRRLPNRFEVLTLYGESESSLLGYTKPMTSSESLEFTSEPDLPEDPTHLRLRGGTNVAPVEADHSSSQDSSLHFSLEFAERFINSRGNEYFCDIDEDYLTDRFNLTSLNTEVQYYQYALDLITDVLDIDVDDDTREHIEKSARHLYGLVHARYIVTTRGLQKMSDKYKNGDFGKCPRVSCDGQPLLPMGQHDSANISAVKLYCARCEDLYNPKSSRHASVDGAYFGSSFHNMFFQVHPNLMPPKSQRRYEPKIFGFKVHAPATLARWQGTKREEVKELLRSEGLETGFEEEEKQEDMEASEEDEEDGQDGIDDMFEGQRVVH